MDSKFTGQQIAQRRKDLGLTQKQLAQQLYVTDKAVSKWERGLNFPDLSLLEQLADVLRTTPACLLGLETANQEELVQSLAALSQEQLADTRKDLGRISWGCILCAGLLCLVYGWYGSKISHELKVLGYQLLSALIGGLSIGGIWMLRRHGQIRRWSTADWLLAYLAGFSTLIFLGFQFFTMKNPPMPLNLILTALAAGALQVLFYRTMAGPFAKALPSVLAVGLLIFQIARDISPAEFGAGAAGCFAAFLICRIRDKARKAPPVKACIAFILAALILFGCFFGIR